MKHFYRITFVMMLMSLLLSIGTNAYAQKIYVESNADGSFNQLEVTEAFQRYIEDSLNYPSMTEDEIQQFVGDFYKNLSSGDVIIRKVDESSEELDDDEINALLKEWCDLLRIELDQRKENQSSDQQGTEPSDMKGEGSSKPIVILIVIAVIVVLVLAVLFWLVNSKKKNKQVLHEVNYSSNDVTIPVSNNDTNINNDVIIRHKTSSVLLPQNLDDVVNNSNYMAINCSEFSNDTAVKTMYLKNTCIIDIYNMYAETLRNPNNPRENGCMVLGRWVHDEKLEEYAVSLEEVVLPGDDAVFTEFDLDFGGKIKVKLNERLRKLRRETNLQYNLTCWVHSHPGLGVFFSNTDCNLHLQHKHAIHPKFLTAIVIDILTPQQELGIFTFKHDMSINSKADLKQLYSLEEWYKWALESKRTAVIYEEHYNTLENAKSHDKDCNSTQLSESTVIDMDTIVTNPNRESLYFVHGFSNLQADLTAHIAATIDKTDAAIDNELIGCFMVVTHRSYPTIKKAVANYLDKVKFVMVYSVADGLLTTIPVIANDLCTDESYYGEQPFEELKIWTRRKR